MNTYLTDSVAREHANALLAEAARGRQRYAARQARRDDKRAATAHRVSRGARRPFAVARHWLLAGDL